MVSGVAGHQHWSGTLCRRHSPAAAEPRAPLLPLGGGQCCISAEPPPPRHPFTVFPGPKGIRNRNNSGISQVDTLPPGVPASSDPRGGQDSEWVTVESAFSSQHLVLPTNPLSWMCCPLEGQTGARVAPTLPPQAGQYPLQATALALLTLLVGPMPASAR